MTPARISVIIAAYNSSLPLRCALRSLCDQTFSDFEAWVIGDEKCGDIQRIVAEFGDSRLSWVNPPRRDARKGAPNNEGLRRARGEYIAYLGHDHLWFPWHLANLLLTIKQNNADFVHGVTALLGPDGPAKAIGVPGLKPSYGHRAVVPSSWMHRRELAEKCEPWPFPEAQITGLDFVFQRRAFLAGHSFACSPQISVLKFPAAWWENHSPKSGHPQPIYLDRMERDARLLHEQVLTELVFSATRDRENVSVRRALAMAVRTMGRRLAGWYGLERWPLSLYMRRRRRRLCQRDMPRKALHSTEVLRRVDIRPVPSERNTIH